MPWLWKQFLIQHRGDMFSVDSGIRKIARAVPESIATAEFILTVTLLFKNLFADYSGLPCGIHL